MVLRTFGWSFAATVVALAAAFLYQGVTAFVLVAVLAILEISLSFDNAVVNAKVLERMSPFWQKIFLTVGVVIAVFGMRLLFPLIIVAVTAGMGGPVKAFDLALDDPDAYQHAMESAHPLIAAFGGMFLLMLFLEFVFQEHPERWLPWLEEPLARLGQVNQLPVVVAGLALVLVSGIYADDPGNVMIAGVLGIMTYILVNGLGELFSEVGASAARAGFFLFLYLEVLDASFSFDGVVGAFAISSDPIVIALGLGVGAMYIRSLTVYLVRKGTLSEYIYLEHGAHWAIGALAVCMLVSIARDVPEWLTGGLGAGLILAAFLSSVVHNLDRRSAAADAGSGTDPEADPEAGPVTESEAEPVADSDAGADVSPERLEDGEYASRNASPIPAARTPEGQRRQ
ncbi:DUF475 domain-containing protein [Actinomadura barringtoniae]|uniref:DUF475 domain-containing protein n=1 Tax=Actinomadura barringtoniae TaxID=1427535 RepID=A0A939T5U3_9ACTN|nr:DUF475 domain-containing protein [Actinomadura barringtoniae]MBO2449949.1 DUF475 domain-containing protein [Actinomadura barringtoniae]